MVFYLISATIIHSEPRSTKSYSMVSGRNIPVKINISINTIIWVYFFVVIIELHLHYYSTNSEK